MESFECRNCFYKGELNKQGRCARCQSDAVISLAAIERSLSVDGFSPEYWTLQTRIRAAVERN